MAELLIVTGVFTAAPPWAMGMAAAAAEGLLLVAAHMIRVHGRISPGPAAREDAAGELRPPEPALLAPFALLILLMGIHPSPFIERISPSADVYAGRVLLKAAPRTHSVGKVALATGDAGGHRPRARPAGASGAHSSRASRVEPGASAGPGRRPRLAAAQRG